MSVERRVCWHGSIRGLKATWIDCGREHRCGSYMDVPICSGKWQAWGLAPKSSYSARQGHVPVLHHVRWGFCLMPATTISWAFKTFFELHIQPNYYRMSDLRPLSLRTWLLDNILAAWILHSRCGLVSLVPWLSHRNSFLGHYTSSSKEMFPDTNMQIDW